MQFSKGPPPTPTPRNNRVDKISWRINFLNFLVLFLGSGLVLCFCFDLELKSEVPETNMQSNADAFCVIARAAGWPFLVLL